MRKRWSKLQSRIYQLFDPKLKLQIHCTAFRDGCDYGQIYAGRYWVTLEKQNIWDFPKQFLNPSTSWNEENLSTTHLIEIEGVMRGCIYIVSDISALIREYIDTPLENLLNKKFENDKFGLTEILKAADRRLGKKKLFDYFGNGNSVNGLKIIQKRYPTAVVG
ncbi:hypothetical protein PN36_05795 [Candidatus Thiomargarita nelsonii]|uniref:Uncharacterized protein n=1 Tax=Candidatus Thiomargarita nelsonii TaxID=1003181 RepID=A0A0A6P9L2_9GAMM|nr:hypothetical protein PN36_05795 [Candidatus Thiomargarita nelsonii]